MALNHISIEDGNMVRNDENGTEELSDPGNESEDNVEVLIQENYVYEIVIYFFNFVSN